MSVEKRHDTVDTADAPALSPAPQDEPKFNVDQGQADDALEFLRLHGVQGNFCHDSVRMRRLTWKIDLVVIPFLLLAYLMNYLDKVLLNVSTHSAISL